MLEKQRLTSAFQTHRAVPSQGGSISFLGDNGLVWLALE